MDINSWKETWGSIDWTFDSDAKVRSKIKKFYKAGVDFNMKNDEDNSGEMPLFWAISHRSPDIISYMIAGGANPEERDNKNRTVLHEAVSANKIENIKYLLEQGPKKIDEKKNFDGDTPLHLAAISGKTEIVRILTDHNSTYINEKDNNGNRPIDFAVYWGYINVVRVLVEHGADVTNIKSFRDKLEPKIEEYITNAKQVRADYLAKKEQESKVVAKKKPSFLARIFGRQHQ